MLRTVHSHGLFENRSLLVDSLVWEAEEGRGKLRKAQGRRTQPLNL
jgi:hypothetical protein